MVALEAERMSPQSLNKVLGALLVAVLVIALVAIWRGQTLHTDQPYVPGKAGQMPK
jgi:hypothetical protein